MPHLHAMPFGVKVGSSALNPGSVVDLAHFAENDSESLINSLNCAISPPIHNVSSKNSRASPPNPLIPR